jgi:hypothetical protein
MERAILLINSESDFIKNLPFIKLYILCDFSKEEEMTLKLKEHVAGTIFLIVKTEDSKLSDKEFIENIITENQSKYDILGFFSDTTEHLESCQILGIKHYHGL